MLAKWSCSNKRLSLDGSKSGTPVTGSFLLPYPATARAQLRDNPTLGNFSYKLIAYNKRYGQRYLPK